MPIIRQSKFKGLRYPHGRRKGELIEMIVLKYPDYIVWLKQQNENPRYQQFYDHIAACVALFDAKPFMSKCEGTVDDKPCTNPVTRFTLNQRGVKPHFWCANCQPPPQGLANEATEATKYYEALDHVLAKCSRKEDNYRGVIESLTRAKGFEGSFTEGNVIRFFYGSDAKPVAQDDEGGV